VTALLPDLVPMLAVEGHSVVQVSGTDVLPSRLAATDLAVGAVGAASLAAAGLSHTRGGPCPAVVVDGRRVSAAFRSDRLVEVDGQPIRGFAELSRFWQTSDGWVRTHANYRHHRGRLLTAVGLPPAAGVHDVAARLRRLTAAEVEDAVVAAGGVCAAVRTAEQWRRHPQGAAARALPLLSTTRLGAAGPRRMAPPPRGPLLPAAGLRVLDLTRVIAGPVATTTLALLGAEVLRLDPPDLPELPELHFVTGLGKRSALLDAAREPTLLARLVAGADVVVTGYRPGSLARLGLSPRRIAAIRPGVVVASLSAWGGVGPWGQRRGFDSIVQAASGIAWLESADGTTPGALPAQALDYATGYVLAAGVLAAVARQHSDGASLHVQAHLARTAAWLVDHPDPTGRALPDVTGLLHERRFSVGRLRYPPPAVQFEDGPSDWSSIEAWGSGTAAWADETARADADRGR
jgi:crotonobetainyl-CoA:carnitine CoA-transferase CaiB-like acyl-CoA transferase